MRQNSAEYQAIQNEETKELRLVVEMNFGTDAAPDTVYFTSHSDIVIPGGVVYPDTVRDLASISQKLNPIEARSEIGSASFDLLDLQSVVSNVFKAKLDAGKGARGKLVRIYSGFKGLPWDKFRKEQTQIVSKRISFDDTRYKVQCEDIQREARRDIAVAAKTRLASAVPAMQRNANGEAITASIAVYDTSGFLPNWHGPSYTLNSATLPAGTLASPRGVYVFRIKYQNGWEICVATGKTPTSFTNVYRGMFSTAIVEHKVDGTANEQNGPEVEEIIYVELPVLKFAYAILTGKLLGQPHTLDAASGTYKDELPESWHLGIPEQYVDKAAFLSEANQGKEDLTDLYKASDDSGYVVRFDHVAKTDGKKFIEKELLLLTGMMMPVRASGDLTLKRMTGVLTDSSYVDVLDATNIIRYSELTHALDEVYNRFSIAWSFLEVPGQTGFYRNDTLIDEESESVHFETKPLPLAFKGLHGARHTENTLKTTFNALRDRHSGPPLRLTLTLLPSKNNLEVGDIVRVRLPQIRDFTGKMIALDRSFEVQSIQIDQSSQQITVQLFGSSRKAAPIVYAANYVLPDGWYNGTLWPQPVTNGISTATANIPAGTYYYPGDLTINHNVTINGTVFLKTRGTLTVNALVDGKGRGGANGAGYFGTTEGTGKVRWYLKKGKRRITSTRGTVNQGQTNTAPQLNIVNNGGTLQGLPASIVGSKGVVGGAGEWHVTGNAENSVSGGAAGLGGAGFIAVVRGIVFGAGGRIDTSGTDGSAGQSGGGVVFSGSGGGGAPGAVFILFDGTPPVPVWNGKIDCWYGDCSLTLGTRATAPEFSYSSGGVPAWHSYYEGKPKENAWQAAFRWGYVPQSISAYPDYTLPTPAPSLFFNAGPWANLAPLNSDAMSIAGRNLRTGDTWFRSSSNEHYAHNGTQWINVSTLGANWSTNVGGRPTELTDGRITLGFNSSGDILRPISTTVRAVSDILGRAGGGVFVGHLGATLGATWGTDINARPTELTDGRVSAGFNASGDYVRGISTTVATASNLLRRTGGGLFTGDNNATYGATWGSSITGQPSDNLLMNDFVHTDTNNITDPTFALSSAVGIGVGKHWSNGSAQAAVNATDGEDGTPAMRITANGAITDVANSRYIPARRGEKFFAYFRAFVSNDFNGSMGLGTNTFNAAKTDLSDWPSINFSGVSLQKGVWADYSGYITVNKVGARFTRARITVRNDATAGYVIFDNVYFGRADRNATLGADWTANVTGRAVELVDGRVAAGFNASGDYVRGISTTVANASNLYRRSGGGLFTGDDNATNGAIWSSNLTGRPTELTDGRVAAGFNASGDYVRGISTTVATASNLLRRAGGGLFIGDENATYGARTGVNLLDQNGAQLIDKDITNYAHNGTNATIAYPQGGNYSSDASSVTGAIKIGLPAAAFRNNTMVRFFVDIYSYTNDGSITLEVGGYNYSDGNWHSVYARIFGGGEYHKYTVRFGEQSGRSCIWIGENSTVWYYPKITIRNVTLGYSNFAVSTWKSDWAINIESISGTYNTSVTDTMPSASWARGTGRPGELIDGRVASGLNSAGDMIRVLPRTVRDGSGLLSVNSGDAYRYTGELNATNGANASNLRYGVGANLIPNSDFSSPNISWVLGWNQTGWPSVSYGRNHAGADWTPTGGNQLGLSRGGAATGVQDLYYQVHIPVIEGQRYELSAYIAAHRTSAAMVVGWYNESGNWITENATGGSAWSGGRSLANWGRVFAIFTAPSGARTARIWMRQEPTSSENPYSWCTQIFFGLAHAGQTEPSPWSPAPTAMVGSYLARDTVNATPINSIVGNLGDGGRATSTRLFRASQAWQNTVTKSNYTTLTASNSGGSCSINIASWTTTYDYGAYSYPSGGISGLSASVKYYVYMVDPYGDGTSITYAATTNFVQVNAAPDRAYLGSITTPANSGGGGIGGGECVAVSMWISSKQCAGDARTGDAVFALFADGSRFDEYPIQRNKISLQECVRLVADNGAAVVCSIDTPVTLRSGDTVLAPNMSGLDVATLIDGELMWSRVVSADYVGWHDVAHISINDGTYAAGEAPNRMIFTHNINAKP